MSIRVGGIDLTQAIIDAEFRIGVLENIIERLSRFAPPGTITQQDMEAIRQQVFERLQKKYPDAGLTWKK